MERVQKDPFTSRNPQVARSPASKKTETEGPRQLRLKAKTMEAFEKSISHVNLTEVEQAQPVEEREEAEDDKEEGPATITTEENEIQEEKWDNEGTDGEEGAKEKSALRKGSEK